MRPGGWRGNQILSQQRANDMASRVQPLVPAGTHLPDAVGLGEVAGHVPDQPSAQLSEEAGSHPSLTLEQMTDLLRHAPEGEREIPNADLHAQFRGLLLNRPDPASRLALFGISDPDSPAAHDLQRSIQTYLDRPGGRRPWDQVFRHLRYGEVQTSRSWVEHGTRTVQHPETTSTMSESDCKSYVTAAMPQLGTIAESARVASDEFCPAKPTSSAPPGCSYELPARRRRRQLAAPEYAPSRLGVTPQQP
jgi:hypothetical protein